MKKRWCSNKIIPHFDKKTGVSRNAIIITKGNRILLTFFLKTKFWGEEEIHFYDGWCPMDFYKDVKYWAYIDTFFKEEINDKDTN